MSTSELFAFRTGQASHVGRVRSVNEDNFLTLPESGLWVVADGMGGHAAGDFASRTIVEHLVSIGIAASTDDQRNRFDERLARANARIQDHAADLGRGSIGSTVAALLVHGDSYVCVWSGDSRIYRLRDGRLEQMSRDHTELQELIEAGRITYEEARTWPRRNVVTRAIGVTPVADCDAVEGRLRNGDMFLLCSDGLTEHITDEELERYLSGRPEPQAACDEIIAATLERGARDNVTVVVLECRETDASAAFDAIDPSVDEYE